MGMFRNCEYGWNYGQFGNFCQMLLQHTTNPHIEYFATFQHNEIPTDRLLSIASGLEEFLTHPAFIEDGQVETMEALISHMKSLAAEGLPMKYE